MRSLLTEQRSAEDARKPDQCRAAACQAIRFAAGADQFTLNAECGGLQRDKIDVLESGAVHSLAKHDCVSSLPLGADESKYRVEGEKVAEVVPRVEKRG